MSEKQATLPKRMEQRNIASMGEGEVAYTVPWAMWSDSGRRLWLNPESPIEAADTGGLTCMRIQRGPDGFKVSPVRDFAYTSGDVLIDGIPVAELTEER